MHFVQVGDAAGALQKSNPATNQLEQSSRSAVFCVLFGHSRKNKVNDTRFEMSSKAKIITSLLLI
jgi:hypothetical protein